MEELQVKAGDIVASKYRVEKVLGVGGMGIVVAARHVALGNLVAIKLMQPRAFGVKGAAERFLREGQAAAQLASPHVAKVLDLGTLDSGAPYMIMEHLTGSDLSTVIEKRGAVPLHDAVEYLLQACDAIGEAHAKGIVHRDLKPANLFLEISPDGSPNIKVLDFGIAKMAGTDQKLTGTSQGMGSGGYMSPEQMSSAKKVDHRADIWALGITLYELVTAQLPFAADSLEQFVARVFFEQPTPLLTHRPDLPIALEAVILRCLEKQPDARYPTVAHFASALAPFAPPRAYPYIDRIARQLGVNLPPEHRPSTPGTMLLPAFPSSPTGPTPGQATTPGMASNPSLLAQTGSGRASYPSVPGQTAPGMASSQPAIVGPPGAMVPGPSGTVVAAQSLSQSQMTMSSSASVPHLQAQVSPVAAPAPSRKTGLFVGVGAVAVLAVAAFVGLRFAGGGHSGTSGDTTSASGSGTNQGDPGTTTTSATTAVTAEVPAQTTTTSTSEPEPASIPSGIPDAGVPPAKHPVPPGKVPPTPKTATSGDPASTKPISTVRDPNPRH